MDANSSNESLVFKVRKPYTISKQRERWTEEEHDRFLEALKLHGRAWQRIEEHIGTKTAVQIRSHAQKFFTKLEKEAQAKGAQVCQALEINIPPPRPKRKPNNPYPRKTCNITAVSQTEAKDVPCPISGSSNCKQTLDLEKEPTPDAHCGEVKPNAKESENDNGSEAFTHSQEAFSSAPTTVALKRSCNVRELVPSLKETSQDYETSKTSNLETTLHDNTFQCMKEGLTGKLSTKAVQGTDHYTRDLPIQIVDGSLGTCTQTKQVMQFQDSMLHDGRANSFADPAASSLSAAKHINAPKSTCQLFPNSKPPFAPTCQSKDDNQISHFSNLIVSTLLQNPAAHAAASFAASYWSYAHTDSSAGSPTSPQGGFPPLPMSSPSSMAAIAAATVAAATAWWAAHGVLPICAPFTCPTLSDIAQGPVAEASRKETTDPNRSFQEKCFNSEYLQFQNSASKLPTVYSPESKENGGTNLDTVLKSPVNEEAPAVTELNHSVITNSRKQIDPSSCGSNTPSSSDVDTQALKKPENSEEELKEAAAANNPVSESIIRRCRSTTSSLNDSWKEVSEGGRMAFRALFSRQVLPQSFSPPHCLKNKGIHVENTEVKQNSMKEGDASLLDLNTNGHSNLFDCQGEDKSTSSTLVENNDQEGLLTISLGYGKLKSRRTGFKPYKRCSVEANVNRGVNTTNQAEENGPKRIRLEGEAST